MGDYEKDKVGFLEYFSIVSITIGLKSTDMTTVLLFKDGLNAAWMIVIGAFLFSIPSLLLLNSVLKKYQCKNILEVTQLTLGKPFTFVIAFLMFGFTLLNTATESRSYITQLITINFPTTPLFILYICFLTLCMWGAKKGWETLGAIAWTTYPYLIIGLGILFFLMFKEVAFNRMFPLFGTGKWEIVKASFNYTSIFGDVFIYTMMYPFVKNHQTYTRSLYSSLLFTVLLMTLLYLSYIWIFDYRSIEKITFPYNEAIRFVSLGRNITNIETFFITIWLVGVFVKFIIYIYLVSKIFGFLFQIEEFEHTIMPMTFLIFVIGMIPENNENNIFHIRTNSLVYFKYLILFLPPLLWVAAKIKEARAG
ncbi:GerAB/ArcD/ProY family transporter [Niallia endozanthoxylica]|uniref:GerAB/ArcD/ProY family transporter n=1 Tax=Niallia endozanthoxylica TaxID=2036016 RepID=UPI00168BD52F|nr:endospore germination permease [Niallia endozanthoxylica]